MRRSVPASTAHDALTHITGKNGASGATYGKRVDAGVIHSGRKGLASSGSAYDEPCYAHARRGGRGGGVKGRGCGDVGGRAVGADVLRELLPSYRAAWRFVRAREG
jgi:hypothetical protein